MKSRALISIFVLGSMWIGNAAFAADDAVKQRYSEYCSVCHGDRGDGRSHAQQGLVPPPRDFTEQTFVSTVTRDRIIAAVTNGVPGTAMIAWTTELNDAEIGELADYVLDEFVRGPKNTPVAAPVPDEFAQIYQESCSVCHGDDGAGAKWGQESLAAKPRDFTSTVSRTELTRERMIISVANGRPGTPMPGFASQLSPQQVEGIVDYVRARFMNSVVAADTKRAIESNADGDYQGRLSRTPTGTTTTSHFRTPSAATSNGAARCISSIASSAMAPLVTAMGRALILFFPSHEISRILPPSRF
jgi:mono/diheme cytochrome c family protein